MTDEQIVDLLYRTGHLQFPFGHEQEVPASAPALPLTHPVVEVAVRSYQDFMAQDLEPLVMAAHGRRANHDGVTGPATRELFAQPRCGHPDYGESAEMKMGTGSWKGCHGVGDFHAATVYVHEEQIPAFLRPVWAEVWNRTAKAYAAIGLRFQLTDDEGSANTSISFVNRAPGWIGLAVVGQNESCSSQIWAKFLGTYNPDDTLGYWTELVMHELGHNASLQHSRGGIMNPSIMRGLAPTWKGDPSESILNRLYGGEPVGGDTPPVPPVDPPTPGTVTVEGGMGTVVLSDGSEHAIDFLPRAK